MTKEKAKEILENWISERTTDSLGEHKDIRLPIFDELVYSKMSFDVAEKINEQWTFRGLIKLIYDLEDKK